MPESDSANSCMFSILLKYVVRRRLLLLIHSGCCLLRMMSSLLVSYYDVILHIKSFKCKKCLKFLQSGCWSFGSGGATSCCEWAIMSREGLKPPNFSAKPRVFIFVNVLTSS